MKRILTWFLTFTLVLSLGATAAAAQTSGVCGDGLTWTLTDGTLTISGTGDMYDYVSVDAVTDDPRAPWEPLKDSVTKVVLSQGVTSIGDYAFEGCAVTGVEIPASVTRIGMSAFRDCVDLTGVTIPDSVTSFGSYIFSGCTGLTSAVLPANLTVIPDAMFFGCTGLSGIALPVALTEIGYGAFYDCESLEGVMLPQGVTKIGASAFKNCVSLSELAIPFGVTTIGASAFDNCDSLSHVLIPDSVTSLGGNAFYGCSNMVEVILLGSVRTIDYLSFGFCAMNSITIPATVTRIGEYAFYQCPNLTDVYFAGTEAQWNAIEVLDNNEPLRSATIHFESIGPEAPEVPGAPEVPEIASFTDVHEGDWYYETVNAAAAAGLIAGSEDGAFYPGLTLTWAQAVTFAVRADQYCLGGYIYGAQDQTGANWYDVYMDYAIDRGILSAVPADPDAIITRGDAAVIFGRAVYGGEVVNVVPEGYFTDVPLGHPAHDAVYLLAELGICNGTGNNAFGVNEQFTRGEVATIVARMTGLVAGALLP